MKSRWVWLAILAASMLGCRANRAVQVPATPACGCNNTPLLRAPDPYSYNTLGAPPTQQGPPPATTVPNF